MTGQEPPRLLTVKDVMERLHLNQDTIRRYIKSGQLKASKFGNRGGWRIKENDLEEFVEQQKKDHAA